MDRNGIVTLLAGHSRDLRAVYRSTLPARFDQLFCGAPHTKVFACGIDGRARRTDKTTRNPSGSAAAVGVVGSVRSKFANDDHELEGLARMRARACRLCRMDSLPRVCDQRRHARLLQPATVHLFRHGIADGLPDFPGPKVPAAVAIFMDGTRRVLAWPYTWQRLWRCVSGCGVHHDVCLCVAISANELQNLLDCSGADCAQLEHRSDDQSVHLVTSSSVARVSGVSWNCASVSVQAAPVYSRDAGALPDAFSLLFCVADVGALTPTHEETFSNRI